MSPYEVLKAAKDSLLLVMSRTSQLEKCKIIADRLLENGNETAAFHMVEKCHEIEDIILKYKVYTYAAEELISSIEKATSRCVLQLVYLSGMKIPQVAKKLNYTERWVRKLHDDAIVELEKRYDIEHETAYN